MHSHSRSVSSEHAICQDEISNILNNIVLCLYRPTITDNELLSLLHLYSNIQNLCALKVIIKFVCIATVYLLMHNTEELCTTWCW